MMKEIGLSFVRIGEFAWSRLEPNEGAYRFEWLGRAIEALDRAGLKVVLGTPTATPPKWLVDKMPEMAALDANGRPRKFGSRRHYCFSHEGYAQECARIVELLARDFGANPAVAAWQTDNEYGCHDTVLSYSPAALEAFRRWCETKYRSIEALNTAWGNVFWSMEYRSFDEIELPNLTVTEANPSHLMDFQRFSSDQVVAFNRRQAQIIRRHAPDATILHNFMGAFVDFDHYALSDDLDVAAWDSYPLGFLERSSHDDGFKLRYMRVGDPDFQAFHHDLYRACGRGRWQVMEQQPGPVNWAPWNPAPAKGAVRLWTFEAFAAGAEAVSYFRWRQAPFAQEQMHEALLLPNAAPNEAYHDVARISKEFAMLDARVETIRAPVALIFDYESAWAWRIQPQGQDFAYFDLVLFVYRSLRRAGLSVDVVPPTAAAIADRTLIIAPALFAPSQDLTAALAKSGATVLLGPRTGSKTADFQIPADLPPGVLRSVIDIRIRRVRKPAARRTDHGLRTWRFRPLARIFNSRRQRRARVHIGRQRNGARAIRQCVLSRRLAGRRIAEQHGAPCGSCRRRIDARSSGGYPRPRQRGDALLFQLRRGDDGYFGAGRRRDSLDRRAPSRTLRRRGLQASHEQRLGRLNGAQPQVIERAR